MGHGERPLDTDLTHGHGQRQAGSHPGHHGRRQAVPRLPREAPRSPAEFLSTAGQLTTLGLHPARYPDLREQAAGLPRHQSRAPRSRTAEPVGLRLLRRARQHPEIPPGSPIRPRFDARCCSKCRGYWPRSTRAGATPAPTSPPIFSSSCKWIAATTRPTGCSTVPPPNRGSTTGTATSSQLGVRFVHGEAASPRASCVRPDTAASPQTPRAGHAGRRHAAGS